MHTVSGVATSITAFVGDAPRGPVDAAVAIGSFGEFEHQYGGLSLDSGLGYAVRDFFEQGGSHAIAVRARERGIRALDDADLVNLLVMTPSPADADVEPAVLAGAIAYATERHALAVLDPPTAWTDVDAAVSGVAELTDSANAAVYFPRIRRPDPLRGGQLATFGPAGAVAGVIARTDAARGVWHAPAGREATIAGVTGLSVTVTDRDNARLNPLGVNCLRELPGSGHVVWAARTRAGADGGASDWKYVPVRRLALYVEESLHRGTQWAVFEPNDEPLWAEIRSDVGAFLQTLFRDSAFQGATPREAYFVKCDATINTPHDIDRGIVNIVVGFAPLKPSEFVVLSLRHIGSTRRDP